MQKINGSPLLQPGLLDKFRKAGQQDEVQKRRADAQGTPAVGDMKPTDTVKISDRARLLVDLREALDVGRAAVAQLPDLREEKVVTARERLASGYYESATVREETAARIVPIVNSFDEL